ncbi:uncharacterized protein LOC122243787 [Penaeus japonicus]|uniref:uncharacterized protein LOC122243787 n=1 Tax=Penaeus japonicus TaxID=27405 RepID=UPI001C716A20|nr:uncharacterized protein LOC122243787 [Penaeus japonicus]
MKVLACVLLAAGLVSAQLINDPAPVDVGALDAAPSAGVAASPAAPAGAGAGAAAGAPATQNFGPAFYGEGLNNPAAFPPSMLVIRRYQQLAKIRPEIRVRVNIDGSVELTDIYGREIDEEVLFPDFEEIQEQRLQAQKHAILRRRQEQNAQLIREFNLGGGAQANDFGFGAQDGFIL